MGEGETPCPFLFTLILNKMDTTLQGRRVRLIKMEDDPNPIEPNTMGTIIWVDGMGQIQVNWDNGRRLALIPSVDEYEIYP